MENQRARQPEWPWSRDYVAPPEAPRKESRLVVDDSICTGCLACQLACSQRQVGGYNPKYGLIVPEPGPAQWSVTVRVCRQCLNSFCARVCPSKAIARDRATGVVRVNREACNGCGVCEDFCPWGLIAIDRQAKVALKCEFCGGDPECVKYCVTGALRFAEVTVP